MFSSNNPVLLVIVISFVVILLNKYNSEGFATNGLNHPADYCNSLTYVYYDPKNPDSDERNAIRKQFCDDASNHIGHNITGRRE